MKQTYFIISALLMIFTDAAFLKACDQNERCAEGECCIRGTCKPFIPVGGKCDLLAQIMRVQCPCAIGSSCFLTDKLPKEEMSCRNIINNPELKEMVENRDWKHIKQNRLED